MALKKYGSEEFRRARKEDIKPIMEIIKDAQAYLKDQGLDQWQNNYPNEGVIREDMGKGYSYVFVEDKAFVGTVAVIFDGEPTYKEIYQGQWLSNGNYATIHRLAVAASHRGGGVTSLILESIEKLCLEKAIYSIKVDTHRGNMPMQRFLKKNGFKYCGIIYLEYGDERLAYEKVLVK